MKQKNAFTLVEILIGVVISVVLLAGVLNLFYSGLKGSAKTLTLQENIETANLIMAQIEHDLSQATEIIIPDCNQENVGSAQWVYDSKSIGSVQYTYDYVMGSKDGVHRKVTGNNIDVENSIGRNHLVDLRFRHFAVDADKDQKGNLITEKHGMWVELTVYSKDDKNEKDSFTMKRLIAIKKPI